MNQASNESGPTLDHTPLHGLHAELGGRLVDFAGWELPIQYEGVIAEHVWCRTNAALFDVSHMGIVEIRGADGDDVPVAELADALETLTPASVATVEQNRQRYALLTNEAGGVIDDFIVTNRGDHLMLVVNAARRHVDIPHLTEALSGFEVTERGDLALIALQGPKAVTALSRLCPTVAGQIFLDFAVVDLNLVDGSGAATGEPIPDVGVSRSGYTGEDGFELMVSSEHAEAVARSLLAQPEVQPAGLGARDTLRLEAGLALYGHDLDETTSPVEADLVWTMPKRRRADARFPGAERILGEYENGASRKRVGLKPEGRRPVRDDTKLRDPDGNDAGIVTSGGYGPTVEGPVAMGYVQTGLAVEGQRLIADVRGNDVDVVVTSLPFTKPNYQRGR